MWREKTIVELFSGTKSMSNAFAARGYKVFTIDNDGALKPDLVADIMQLSRSDLPRVFRRPRVVWASPPCQKFSVCTIGHNWNTDHTPKTAEAEAAMQLVIKTLQLIQDLQPRYWFIENPRGKLRRMPFMQGFKRRTVTYCQYGDRNQKPTDIWSNCGHWVPRPACTAGALCHDPAPRGSHDTGVQSMSCAKERGKIPVQLCAEIARVCEL